MTSKIGERGSGTLADIVGPAPFAEHHIGVVEASADAVWDALQGLRWRDLRLGYPLVVMRGLIGGTGGESVHRTFVERAGALHVEREPVWDAVIMIGKPWSVIPQRWGHAVTTTQQIRTFREPGWLKYGIEWVLHPVGAERTMIETRTLCVPTSRKAHRAFRAYWTMIRPFSGLIRREMIAAVARTAERSGGRAAVGRIGTTLHNVDYR